MRTFLAPGEIPADHGSAAVTIGKFDGVHAGHRAVIARLIELARQRDLTATVVSFDRHPLSLLNPDACPAPLASNAQRLELLEAAGVDATLLLTFDEALAALPPEQFVESILVTALNTRVLLVGSDFRFGAHGAGDVALLHRLGARHGFDVEIVADVEGGEGSRVSSTRIRQLLTEGRVAEAATALGQLHTIRSLVVHGEARGRTLGYPTANLSPDVEGFIPRDGVYAAWLTANGVRYPAAVSIGNNPTFEGIADKTVEAHAIDQHFDLYDTTVEISFVEYVRPMHKFPSAVELAEQMGRDELAIRAILGVPTS